MPAGVKPWPGSVPAVCSLGASAALIAFALTAGPDRRWPQAHARPPQLAVAAATQLATSPSPAMVPVSAGAPRERDAEPASAAIGGEFIPDTEVDSFTLVDSVEPGPVADTPLDEHDAAEYLARAWRAVLGRPARETTVAVLWAHWAHETARGRRMHGFNFGGIKGRGPAGASVVVWTREGPRMTDLVQRTFRAYETPREGAHDYVALLRTRYRKAFRAARYGHVDEFVTALEQGGYFTADGGVYLRALTMLNGECRRRGISAAAVVRVRENPGLAGHGPAR